MTSREVSRSWLPWAIALMFAASLALGLASCASAPLQRQRSTLALVNNAVAALEAVAVAERQAHAVGAVTPDVHTKWRIWIFAQADDLEAVTKAIQANAFNAARLRVVQLRALAPPELTTAAKPIYTFFEALRLLEEGLK